MTSSGRRSSRGNIVIYVAARGTDGGTMIWSPLGRRRRKATGGAALEEVEQRGALRMEEVHNRVGEDREDREDSELGTVVDSSGRGPL